MDKKVSIQITNYNEKLLKLLIKEAGEAGFKYASMGLGDEKPLIQDNWIEYIEDLGETMYKYGLKCNQTHAPYYDLLISAEKRDENMEKAFMRMIQATKMLGAEICAVHPRSVINKDLPRELAVDRQKSLEENIIAFTPIVEECEKQGVLLGIENLMTFPHIHPHFYSSIADDHVELIDKLNSKNVCAIWDFGHANLVDVDHAERIKKLGSRIKGTHVHNNDGHEDTHFPPFLPPQNAYYTRRSVDWNKVLKALKETGYEGYLTLEPIINNTYPFEGGYIHYLYQSVCALDDIMNKESNE